jgi:hypothetical protein
MQKQYSFGCNCTTMNSEPLSQGDARSNHLHRVADAEVSRPLYVFRAALVARDCQIAVK